MDWVLFFTAITYSILGKFELPSLDILALLVILIVIGLVVVVLVKFFLILLPAILIAIVVYLLTSNALWAGIAFLVVALLSLIRKL
ncbi:MAG: hypothetical protein LBQ98_04095 [Nitrososphaerota archaeon]|jgi:hypothetical protein|nr:hypothetical protein [Nitrososphaerota archaeon]